MDNRQVAAALDEWADILEVERARRYHIRAYRRAAESIAALETPVADAADLTAVPGVGERIAGHVQDILRGSWPRLEEARRRHGPAEVAARHRELLAALRGDLHAHTLATDGRDTIEAMAQAAARRGYEYLALTDHSQTTRIAGGLDEERMRAHMDGIRRVAEHVEDVRLLAGAEVDIRKDGTLDYTDALLGDLDVVVCSVHFRYKMDGQEQTERILSAMSNDHADILGHPTARRAPKRPGMELDMPRLYEAAAGQGWAMEMNGSPERLDLDAEAARAASAAGVRVSIASDAHATYELQNVRHGCREAARAGLEADHDVVNAKPLAQLMRAFA